MEKNSRNGKIGVLKGTKRGTYKRCKDKREQKDINEDGLSYQEIGVILGISAAEVKQIEQMALKKLRSPKGIARLLFEYNRIGDAPTERIDI